MRLLADWHSIIHNVNALDFETALACEEGR